MKNASTFYQRSLVFFLLLLSGPTSLGGARLRTSDPIGSLSHTNYTSSDTHLLSPMVRHGGTDAKGYVGTTASTKPPQSEDLHFMQHEAESMSFNASSMQFNRTARDAISRGPAKVHFLFLAMDRISNLNVWTVFFEDAPKDRFSALVHCKMPGPCQASITGTSMTMVPTVPSYYCTDLVSPMNRLLSYALMDATPEDKFVFISDSTLPAKPFSEVYDTLIKRHGSAFCLFPSAEWADIPGADGIDLAAKHHQWIILNYDHAKKADNLWRQGHGHDFMRRYHMNSVPYSSVDNTFGDDRNFGCLDEFWHWLTIFGPLQLHRAKSEHWTHIPNLQAGSIYVGRAGWQGTCDTFVLWWKYLHETSSGYNPFIKLYNSLDGISKPHGGNNARPGWWDTISRQGIRAIRDSDFLFVRKFIDNPTLSDGGTFFFAYSAIVLAEKTGPKPW